MGYVLGLCIVGGIGVAAYVVVILIKDSKKSKKR